MAVMVEKGRADSFISCAYIFVNLGIHNIHFNLLDKQTFLDTQQHSANYNDLEIQVAGFNAYFVDLMKEFQNQIIAEPSRYFTSDYSCRRHFKIHVDKGRQNR